MEARVLAFLTGLRDNNDREWFLGHKDEYNDAKDAFEKFINELIPPIRSFDTTLDLVTAKDCMFRIYRDVRFSKDKRPYKTNMGAYINRGGKKSPFAGYYVHIEPGASFLAGGIYMPPPDVLKKIREEIMYNYSDFITVTQDSQFRKIFGEMDDPEKLVKPPKGFPQDFPGIGFLKFKSYAVMHQISDQQVNSKDLGDYAIDVFKVLWPLNKFFNNVFI